MSSLADEHGRIRAISSIQQKGARHFGVVYWQRYVALQRSWSGLAHATKRTSIAAGPANHAQAMTAERAMELAIAMHVQLARRMTHAPMRRTHVRPIQIASIC